MRVWRKIEPLLQDAAQPYHVHYTRFPGDATNAAEQLRKEGAEIVVGVGGDGTLQEVVNGLDMEKNIFGIIPAGTGNGFRRSLQIPGDCRQALHGLLKWKHRKVDLGIINGMYFLNVVGFGFDAAVAKLACVDNRILRGYPAYVSAVIAKLATFKSFNSTVTHDSCVREEQKTLLAVISNGCYYGGKLCIAPQARLDDGKLDLCIIRKANPVSIVNVVLKAFFKKHLGHRSLYIASCEGVNMEAPESIPVHVDGEIIGSLPARISVSPGILSVIAPPVKQEIESKESSGVFDSGVDHSDD